MNNKSLRYLAILGLAASLNAQPQEAAPQAQKEQKEQNYYHPIKISDEDIKKLGISTIKILEGGDIKSIPFNATLDFDSKTSITQSSTYDAIVVALYKREGEAIKKGEVICEISSDDLNKLFFELENTRNRYRIAEEIAKKDRRLFQTGVISQREYQVSYLNANEMRLKLLQVQSTFSTFGIDAKNPKGKHGFRIIAKESGILAVAPKQTGEKITAFSPYIRINSGSELLAYIRVPIHMAKYVKPGSQVYERSRQVGMITTISVVIDKTSNTVLATAVIDKSGFKVGQTTELYVEGKMAENSIIVPVEAIIKNGNDYLVFKHTQDGFLPIKIKILEEKDKAFLVQSSQALKMGDEVAIGSIIALKGVINNIGE